MRSGFRNYLDKKKADQDADIMLLYIQEHWSFRQQQKLIDTVNTILFRILESPTTFPLVKGNVRKAFISKAYSIYSIVRYERITILRIFDQRQDSNKLRL